jgi:hypothetical protein
MTERTVTGKQVVDAIEKLNIDTPIAMGLLKELFPERPNHNELIKVWDGSTEPEDNEVWRRFKKMAPDGDAITYVGAGPMGLRWDNYRRKTPAERGEG